MPRIFISYRREDSAGQAGRLNDRLSAAFGPGQVFIDVDDIQPGENFPTMLRRSVEGADTALVLIGPKWLTASDAQGRRRLEDEQDFVRREVGEALASGKRVVPILLNGAPMPEASELPSPLQGLALCQAFELSDTRFDRDAAALIEDLGGEPPGLWHAPRRAGSGRWRWLVIGAAAVAAAIGGWQAWPRQSVESVHPPPPPPAVTDVDVTGAWEADVFYEWDKRTVHEPFRFRFVAGQLTGSAGFLGYPRGIVEGEVRGRTIVFETRSQASVGDKDFQYVHRYRGDIAGDEIRMVMQTIGPYQDGAPREFVLRRVKAEDGPPPRDKAAR